MPPGPVIITGASGGLGAALAHHYARGGANLGLIARRSAELERFAREFPGRCAFHAADVRDSAAMRRAATEFMTQHGVPEVVIANAGVSIGTLTELAEDEQAFRDVFDINVIGMVNTFQPYIAAMRVRGHGVLAPIRRPRPRPSVTSRVCAWNCAAAASRSSPSVPATSARR
jgi:NADP-dependent 3-hydroxy acid dehydrogenase YdfG